MWDILPGGRRRDVRIDFEGGSWRNLVCSGDRLTITNALCALESCYDTYTNSRILGHESFAQTSFD